MALPHPCGSSCASATSAWRPSRCQLVRTPKPQHWSQRWSQVAARLRRCYNLRVVECRLAAVVLALALGAGRVRPASPPPLQQPATALADHTSSGGRFPHFGTAPAAQCSQLHQRPASTRTR